jgi:hypothetical protein
VGDSGSFEVGLFGGKNFVEITTDTKTSAGVTFTKNTDNSFSLSGTCQNNLVHHIGRAYLVKGTEYKITGCHNGGASDTYLIRVIYPDVSKAVEEKGGGLLFTPSATGFFTVGIRVQQGTVTDGLKFFPMIRYSSETDETYEPCNKQTLEVPYTLRSVGDVKDEVDFNRGVYGKKLELATITTVRGVTELTNCVRVQVQVPYTVKSYIALCSHFVRLVDHTADNEHFYCGLDYDNAFLFINKSRLSAYDKDTIQSWIVAQGIKILFQPTPTETPLTEQELNAYRHLYTNKGNTTILSECEDTEITYYINKPNAQAIGNIHTQVNADYFKLQQAIISLGGN